MTWNVRIGINPLSWMNDDLPSLGGAADLDDVLAQGRQIGYTGFELGNKFPKEGRALKAQLDAHGLACVSGWYSGFLAEQTVSAEIHRADAHMRKLRHNGCRVVVYGECAGTIQGRIDVPLGERPRFADMAAWEAYARRLDRFGAHLQREYGLMLAYPPSHGRLRRIAGRRATLDATHRPVLRRPVVRHRTCVLRRRGRSGRVAARPTSSASCTCIARTCVRPSSRRHATSAGVS